jgi:hypothetical protein
MRRIVRDRRLSAEEVAEYNHIRRQLDNELPALIERHYQRAEAAMSEPDEAAAFFGNSPEDSAGLEQHIQNSEASFEERAVRTLLKRFSINPSGWDVREKMGSRLRFPIFDEAYPRFPVRLGTRRLVAKRLQSDKRRKGDLAFHELKPNILFREEELRRTQLYKEWELLKEDQSVDGRPVGLVFQCVNTLFVAHDWAYEGITGIWLTVLEVRGYRMKVELYDQFLDAVAEFGWRPE